MIAAHCDPDPTSCGNRFEAKLIEVVTECEPIIRDLAVTDPIGAAAVWLQVGALFVMNRVPCINDGAAAPNTKWCFAEFKLFSERLSTADTNPLVAADLDQGCTVCTVKVLAVWLAFEPEAEAIYATAYINLLCTNLDGTWCTLVFSAAASQFEGATQDQIAALIPQYCVPCTFHFLFKWKAILVWIFTNVSPTAEILAAIGEVDKLVAGSAWMCVKNPDTNQYCALALESYDFASIDTACANTAGQCAGACKTAIAGALDSLGCCVDTWLTFQTWACSAFNPTPSPDCTDPTKPTPAAIRFMIENLCGLTIELGCGRRLELAASVVLTNIVWTWCNTHQTECLDLVRAAIALHFALDRAEVDAVVTMQSISQGPATAGTRRLLTSDSIAISFSGASDAVGSVRAVSGSTTVPNTPPQARGDIETASELMVLTANVKQSSAAGLVPSLALILLAIAALLF
jgi:hypothetical protein